MDISSFDKIIDKVERIQYNSEVINTTAHNLEHELDKALGLECHNREPGFACWTHEEITGYYNTPRDAFIALEKLRSHRNAKSKQSA